MGDGSRGRAGPAVLALALLAASYLLTQPAREHVSAPRRSVWISRAVLTLAALLLIRISLGIVADPVGTLGPRGFSFGSPDAVTAMRVSGGTLFAIAAALLYCALSERRLLAGLGFLLTVAVTLLALRLLGLALDGPGPFTLMVLKPEIALVMVSSAALVLERRRAQPGASGSVQSA